MKSSPLTQVKERFTDKAGLVKALESLTTADLWLGRINEDKGLDCVSNRKLLHLHDLLTEVKSKFGSRAGLIDAIRKADKREKDDGYRTHLEKWPTPRLLDAVRARAKNAS